MAGFSVLFPTLLRHYFGLSVLRERIRRRQELWKPAVSILAVLGVGIPFLYGYVELLLLIYNMSVPLQQPGLVVLFGFLAVQVMVLVFGLFYLASVFYYSSDLEYLIPMPFRPETILGAKFGIVLLTEYATVLPIALPPVVIFGLRQGFGLAYWLESVLVIALLPMLPLALAAVLAVIIMSSTNLSRHRDAMRVAAGVVSVVAVMVFQWFMSRLAMEGTDPNEVLGSLLATQNGLMQLLGKRFPPALWGAQALVFQGVDALRTMLAYLAGTAVALGLVWWVARRFFYTGLLHSTIHPRAKRHHQKDLAVAIATRSTLWAFIQREWLLLTRNPIFAMTAVFNLFLPPILLALPILGAGEQLIDMKAALASPRFYIWGSLSVAALFGALGPFSSIPSTAISREGRLFWLSRTIPVSSNTQLLAKLVFSVLSVSVSALLVLAVAGSFLGLPFAIMGIGTLLGLLALIISSAISLAIDALWPRLDWENPQQAMKGNQNVLVAMVAVAAVGYGFVRLTLWIMDHNLSNHSVLMIVGLMLALCVGVSIQGLLKVGQQLYTPRTATGRTRSNPHLFRMVRKNGRAVVQLVAIAVLVFFVGREMYMSRTLTYHLRPDSVEFASVKIPYTDITDVQILERIPTMSQRVGTSMGQYRAGTFTVEGLGRGKVYATDTSKPAVLIRTQEAFYIITPDNTETWYTTLQQNIMRNQPPK